MLKQVFIVNKDLGMRAGKIIVHVLHAETLYMEEIMMLTALNVSTYIEDNQRKMLINFNEWRQREVEPIGVMTKIVKKATCRELLEIMHTLDEKGNIKYFPIYDLGNTQVPSGSLTCICTEPLEQETVDKLFGCLKLL